ncbi:MAG: DEAD/DEAH box helicase [Salana multivorans]|uniref:DEAD/DEAH box helicase n=1 Tax=Salana multivorans TaxID=120377 RepID=UPI00096448B8|nr:DEAD/DEAH box helicase [Salana multivorans]MBN8883600.1 DEAD/DEAH box helicase [Salana multivorans]OJX94331.1 MAG: RNA helicase [Micrococcales bacterium 73-15]
MTSPELSPAERYAAHAARTRRQRAVGATAEDLDSFVRRQEFVLDDFQLTACEHLAGGQDVLVAAPTGAGKTIVGEFAVHLALATGRKAFYTTPIKALSNQKYLELAAVHGANRVGLLTGDQTINGEADVVVMTTEVLRNMIYARSATLEGLGYVVMDEVHYLADASRGGVWEEVILLLAPDARLVSLSATVSNAEEFGSWLSEVRGSTAVVVSERRPVPLWQQMMVRNDMIPLYAATGVDAADPGRDPRVNPDLVEAIRRAERAEGSGGDRRGRGRRDDRRGRGSRHGRERGGVRAPRRSTVVTTLDAGGLLPAIYFIFSRAGCEAAVEQVLASGARFTTPSERDLIAETLHEISMRIPGEDLAAVGFTSFAQALSRGVAAHHAGMLPVFKEAVEQLFAAGLIKVVFATETLALGINMPARSVVLESLVKWDGRAHVAVTPGEYTQLTGRAGRRGIDVEGHAVVLYASGVDPVGVAGLASRRTYPLRSSFRPTYNMAVNLLSSRPRDRVRELLEQSFAQFQADAGVVHLARQLRKHEDAIAGYLASAACDRGDVGEYLELQARISAIESSDQRERSAGRRRAVADQLGSLRPGDVIEIPRGRRAGWAVVLEAGTPGLDGPRPEVLGEDRQVRTIGHAEAPHGVRVAGRVRIPRGFSARDPRQRRDLASSLRNALADGLPGGASAELPSVDRTGDRAEELASLRRLLRAHPVHGCAEREDHLRWARRLTSLEAERDKLVQRISNRTTSIARDFDKVCEVLLTLGYLAEEGGEDGAVRVTASGRWLRRLYAERDLVLAQTLRSGHWDHLDAAELAAAATCIVYSPRGDDEGDPVVPRGLGARLELAVGTAMGRGDEVGDLERRVGLASSDAVHPGLVRTMLEWARGGSLADVLSRGDLLAGDFVRWARQVLDVLDQIAVAAPDAGLRDTARDAIDLVRRGVVGQDLV